MTKLKLAGLAIASAVALTLTGCGDNEELNCRISVQKAIDEGRFDTAITQLEGECKNYFDQSDLSYNLATAYMGKAGFSLSDLLKIALDSGDADDAFAAFMSSIDKQAHDESMKFLNEAKRYYLESIGMDSNTSLGDICDDPVLSEQVRVQNVCTYAPLALLTKSTITVSYLTNDVEKVAEVISNTDSIEDIPLDMKASTDAMAWAIGQTPPNDSNITAKPVTIKDKSYAHLNVVLQDKTFYRLAKDTTPSPTNSTILTNGYCTTDGNTTACEGIENEDGSIDTTNPAAAICYACPVDLGGDSAAITDILVDTLNEGTDAITSIYSSQTDVDIEQSIADIKKDITGGEDRDVTVDDIIKYLNDEQVDYIDYSGYSY